MTEENEGFTDVVGKAKRGIEKTIDDRIQRALDGDEDWPALRRYVDRRIKKYLASQSGEPRPPWSSD